MKSLKRMLRQALATNRMRWLAVPALWFWTRYRWLIDYWLLLGFHPTEMPDSDDDDAWADYVYGARGGVFRPLQSRFELAGLVGLVRSRRPRVVVEIGTARGGTLCMLCRAASQDALVISVDLPGGIGGAGYPAWKADIYRQFVRESQQIKTVSGNSHSDSIRSEVVQLLEGRGVDVLIIDGDHGYEGVKSDFQHYSTLVNEGGLIVFHDIVPNPGNPAIEVDQFWRDIEHQYETEEIIDPLGLSQFGIGVIHWPRH